MPSAIGVDPLRPAGFHHGENRPADAGAADESPMYRERVLTPIRQWRRGDGGLTEDSRMFAVALAALNWMGATVSALWLLLPHPDGANMTPIIIATLAAYLLGVLLLAGSRPHPLWMFQGAIALDTLVISVALVATGDPGSVYAFYYLWATLYAVCFFKRPPDRGARRVGVSRIRPVARADRRAARGRARRPVDAADGHAARGRDARAPADQPAPPQRGAAASRRRPRCPHRPSQPHALRRTARRGAGRRRPGRGRVHRPRRLQARQRQPRPRGGGCAAARGRAAAPRTGRGHDRDRPFRWRRVPRADPAKRPTQRHDG